MSKQKNSYQQQTLFEEVELPNKENYEFLLASQVVIEDDVLLELEDIEQQMLEQPMPTKRHWLWRVVLLLFVLLISLETVDFFMQGFQQSPFIASLYALLLLLLTFILSTKMIKEFVAVRAFSKRDKVKAEAKELANIPIGNEALPLCEKITAQLPSDLVANSEHWFENSQLQALSNQEVLTLYSRDVLTQVDEKALKKVSKYATESVVLVALSPIAIIDMLLMLWRNIKMLNEVASLYGLKLGYWSRIKLIKQVLVNLVYAGASELLADIGSQVVAAELMGKFSARLAQGLGAGMLTARLGLKVMHLARPIAFDEQAPKLKDVRKQLISELNVLLKNKSPEKKVE